MLQIKLNKSNLEIKRLVDITINNIEKYNLNLDKEPLRRSKKNETLRNLDAWNKISYDFFGNILYKNTLNIYSWWKRDTNNYRSKVKLKLNERQNEDMEIDQKEIRKPDEIKIVLTDEDVNLLQNFISNYQYRSKFNTEFDDFLSERLQKHEIKCWLRSKSNWFKKERSQKSLAPFWSGFFSCLDPKCQNKFKASIKNDLKISRTIRQLSSTQIQNNHIIVIPYLKTTHESIIKPKIHCTGKKRVEQQVECLAHGVSKTVFDNFIFNEANESFIRQKVTNRFTLSMMKSSLVHFYKISNEVFVDALATKNITDQIVTTENSQLKGFIHNISLDPFGYLLMSQVQ
ncbi:unnamed protein product, partial [Brachionus calyciflorus]